MDYYINKKKKKQNKTKALSFFLTLSFSLFLFSLYITSHHNPTPLHHVPTTLSGGGAAACPGIRRLDDYAAKCVYIKTHGGGCRSQGYFNYLEIFYCAGNAVFGYFVLATWLAVLFCFLGQTASDYFCPSVGGLATVLKLPPTIAGTTLLPLGNGANDVFSSIISFGQSGSADIGLNGVLGGAFFICCVVVGVVSVCVAPRAVTVDRTCFVRDVVFFLFVLCCLLVIIALGRITFWFALGFVSLYLFYIALVSATEMIRYDCKVDSECGLGNPTAEDESIADQRIPLLGDAGVLEIDNLKRRSWWSSVLRGVELLLDLPRMLTIPTTIESKWSKPITVASSTFAPILLVIIYAAAPERDFRTSTPTLTAGIVAGLIFGTLTLAFTGASAPPAGVRRLPWLIGGFSMSIVWTYVVARELVSLLLAIGEVVGISPAILGFTVLAWGNSVGDLVADVAMAVKGGADGAQVAVSGCYAGAVFNTVVGLGLSMVFAAYRSPAGIPRNAEVAETVAFLMAALVWALLVLPRRNMQLDRWLGGGLLIIRQLQGQQ
ncbi:cation/calcium exchanger 1-like isoform X2 [Andrographis paniculata]|uniref:cation/calcium exchanger 1-like isoform X2 n=1 Tax=Andrographis paniculata TaxID=175694 RepID=UPI0021E90380|nr:cation/calcium exchanger 1-like isoform X2 [Andrographis paniculata]